MDFSTCLNEYCSQLGCTVSELSEATGLSAAVISRYRSGMRRPDPDGEQLQKLIRGLHSIAMDKNIPGFSEQDLYQSLQNHLLQEDSDLSMMAKNFDTLMSILNVNVNHLSHYLKYDTSFVSRIRSGQRRPSDPKRFIDDVCRYIGKNYNSEYDRVSIAHLLGLNQLPDDFNEYIGILKGWFSQNAKKDTESINSLIKKMSEFNLNEYIRAIHFNEIKVPSLPFYIPHSKDYIGIEEIKNAELDFLKTTVVSNSMEPVLLCSDMPMEDMSDDDFPKKYLYGLAVMLKKGLHLNVVHNLDRPFNEILLGLEGWLPMYMTGKITPYYFKCRSNEIFMHFHNVSGSAALIGECISGHHDDVRYHLTVKAEDIAYYKREAGYILEKASHLMDIYTVEEKNILNAFLNQDARTEGKHKNILSLPPLYTISDELLDEILQENHVKASDQELIKVSFVNQKQRIQTIFSCGSSISDEVSVLTQEEFQQYPAVLSIANSFLEENIYYTYEQYQKHLSLTKEFARKNPQYTVLLSSNRGFRNIQVIIHCGKWAMFSKGTNPAIHFVTRHPSLLAGLENLSFPMKDQ